MTDIKKSSEARTRGRSGRRKKRKMNATDLIKLLRRHSTLTLGVCVLLVSVVTAYLAIEFGSSPSSATSQAA